MAPIGALLPARVELLSSHHDVTGFDCGEHPLNYFLRRYAAANQAARISNTYVAIEQGSTGIISGPILGYYTLSLLSISRDDLPPGLAARLPNTQYPPVFWAGWPLIRHFRDKGSEDSCSSIPLRKS